MTLRSTLTIFARTMRLGPRSPFFWWALALPVLFTFLVQGVFGDLFAPSPTLVVVDFGNSEVAARAETLEGVDVFRLDDVESLTQAVEAHDFDAGLILREGFDEALRAGTRPLLEFYVAGESLASNRVVLAITTLDLIRAVEGSTPPIDVSVVSLGAEAIGTAQRTLPLIAMMAVAVAGAFVPAANLVQEKEDRTMNAVLVTPATIGDFFGAKALMGVVLAVMTGVVTLALNNTFGSDPLAMMMVIGVAAIMMAELGLVLGAWAPDQNAMFAAWKTGAILIIFPVIFYLFPTLPQWIAQLGPTYYFLNPLFELAIGGARLSDVIGNLAVALAVCVALLPLVVWSARRLEQRMAST